MASTPASDSQVSIHFPRPSTERDQVFGYPLRFDWILDFGRKHNLDPENQFNCLVKSVELIRDELRKDGEYALVRYRCVPPGVIAQIYVARNFLRPMRGSTNEALLHVNVEKLKKFLDTTDEPRWMNA